MRDAATSAHFRRMCTAAVGLFAAALLVPAVSSAAGTGAPNTAYRVSDAEGGCYAESIPHKERGQDGRTYVHRVGDEEPLYTFDWYASELDIHCPVPGPDGRSGIILVRFGPPARGGRANRSDVALAFYFDERLTRLYSTLDIAGRPETVRRTASHYTIIESTHLDRSADHLVVTTIDGRTLTMDLATGDLLPSPASRPG